MPIKEGRAKGKSYDDQEKVVLVTTMALFDNISDSWWIGSSHHIFFRKEEIGANMISELHFGSYRNKQHSMINKHPVI